MAEKELLKPTTARAQDGRTLASLPSHPREKIQQEQDSDYKITFLRQDLEKLPIDHPFRKWGEEWLRDYLKSQIVLRSWVRDATKTVAEDLSTLLSIIEHEPELREMVTIVPTQLKAWQRNFSGPLYLGGKIKVGSTEHELGIVSTQAKISGEGLYNPGLQIFRNDCAYSSGCVSYNRDALYLRGTTALGSSASSYIQVLRDRAGLKELVTDKFVADFSFYPLSKAAARAVTEQIFCHEISHLQNNGDFLAYKKTCEVLLRQGYLNQLPNDDQILELSLVCENDPFSIDGNLYVLERFSGHLPPAAYTWLSGGTKWKEVSVQSGKDILARTINLTKEQRKEFEKAIENIKSTPSLVGNRETRRGLLVAMEEFINRPGHAAPQDVQGWSQLSNEWNDAVERMHHKKSLSIEEQELWQKIQKTLKEKTK